MHYSGNSSLSGFTISNTKTYVKIPRGDLTSTKAWNMIIHCWCLNKYIYTYYKPFLTMRLTVGHYDSPAFEACALS